MSRFFIPLIVFVALAGTLFVGLRHQASTPDPTALPSPLVGRALPALEGAVLTASEAMGRSSTFRADQLKGQVWLLNVWASWCSSCLREHPVFLAHAADSGVLLVGFNYQDDAAKADAWLKRHGNPYALTFSDPSGRLGMNLGVVALPETFVVDRRGHIRHKFTGPLSEEDWRTVVQPLIKALQHE